MSQFNLPSSPIISSFNINGFGGVDFRSAPHQIHKRRSPSCVNMIRDKNGSLRKRMGYENIFSDPYSKRVNGGCFNGEKHYIHIGQILYSLDQAGEYKEIIHHLPDTKSFFIKGKDSICILTGTAIFRLDQNDEMSILSDGAYVPTVIISKSPQGGGELYEDYNFLSPLWKEQFLSDGESLVYHLEKKNIHGIASVKVRNAQGDFVVLEKDKYTISLSEGTITFSEPIPKPDVVGMDNVIIEVSKSEGGIEMIFGCTIGTIYGANGKNDRLFLSGNPDHVGMDFFSASGNFSYFPHMNYSKLSEYSISGYSVSDGSLYTHISPDGFGQSYVIKRNGSETDDGRDVFVITEEFSSPTLCSPRTTFKLGGEAVFLAKGGVYGITVSDVTKERCCELRSAYFGKVFDSFSNRELEESSAIIFGDFYAIFIGGKVFILDGAEKSYVSSSPLCTFQYECYYWENVPASVSWTDGNKIYFGDVCGNVYSFFADKDSTDSYTDNGEAVVCHFDTAEIDDRSFFKKKTYVSVSAKIGAFLNTGVKIYARTDGKLHENPVYDSMGRGKYFSFSVVSFRNISFSSNRSEVTLCGKVRIRNTDSVSFRLINDKAEPFSLYAFGTEYVQKDNYIR